MGFVDMVLNVFNPKKGGGLNETITASVLALIFCVGLVIALFVPTNDKVLDFFIIVFTSVSSFYFGGKTATYGSSKKNKPRAKK